MGRPARQECTTQALGARIAGGPSRYATANSRTLAGTAISPDTFEGTYQTDKRSTSWLKIKNPQYSPRVKT